MGVSHGNNSSYMKTEMDTALLTMGAGSKRLAVWLAADEAFCSVLKLQSSMPGLHFGERTWSRDWVRQHPASWFCHRQSQDWMVLKLKPTGGYE